MRIKHTIVAITALIFCLGFSQKALAHGDIKTQIESRMSWGKADRLAYLFGEEGITLELLADPIEKTVEEGEKEILAFFEAYPPKKCEITSQGTYKNGTRYFEGTYTTTEGVTYQAYFEASLNQDEGHYHLSHIRIER